MDYVYNHNLEESHTYKVALNCFADLTNEEFQSLYLGKNNVYHPQFKNTKRFDPSTINPRLALLADVSKSLFVHFLLFIFHFTMMAYFVIYLFYFIFIFLPPTLSLFFIYLFYFTTIAYFAFLFL